MSVLPYQEVTRRIEELTRAIYSLDPYFVMPPPPGESADESVATLSMLVSTADCARANRRPRSPERRERRRPEREARDQISLAVTDAPARAKSPGWVLEGTTYAEIVKGQNSRSSSIAGTRQLSAQRHPSARRESSPRRVQYEAYKQARMSPEEDRTSEVISVPVQTRVSIEPMYEPVYDPSDRYCQKVVYENVSESVPYRDDANVYVYQEPVSESSPVSQEIHQYYENQPIYYQLESRDSHIEVTSPKVVEEPKTQYISELEPPHNDETAQSSAAICRSQDLSYAEILALGLRRRPKTQSVTTLPKPQVAQVELIKEVVVEQNVEMSPHIQQFEPKVDRVDYSKSRPGEPERPYQRSRSRDMPRQRRAPEKRPTKAHDVQTQKKKKLPKKVVEVQDFDDVIETEQISAPVPVQPVSEHREERTTEVSNASPTTREITKKVQHSSTVVETVTETFTAEESQSISEANADSTEHKKTKKKTKHKKIKTSDEIEKALKEIQISEKTKKKKSKETMDGGKNADLIIEQTHEEIVEPVIQIEETQSKGLETTTKTKKKKGHKEQLKEMTPALEVTTPDIFINEPGTIESQENIPKTTKQKKKKVQKEIKQSIEPTVEDINREFIREKSDVVTKTETHDSVKDAVTEMPAGTQQVEDVSIPEDETILKISVPLIDNQSVVTENFGDTESKETLATSTTDLAEIKIGDSSNSKKKKGLKDKPSHNKAAEIVQESTTVKSLTQIRTDPEEDITEQSTIQSEVTDINPAAKSKKKKKSKKHEKVREPTSVETVNVLIETSDAYDVCVPEIPDVKEIKCPEHTQEKYDEPKDFIEDHEKTEVPVEIKKHHETKGSKKKSKSKKTKEFEPKDHELDDKESGLPVHKEDENIDDEVIVTTEEAQFEEVKTHKKKSKSKKAKVADDDIEKALREIEHSESTKRKPKDKASKNKEKRGAVYVEEIKTHNVKSGDQSPEIEKIVSSKENIITMDWNTLMAEEEGMTEPLIEPMEQHPPDVIETNQQIATEVTIVQETDNLLRQEIENIVKEAEIIKAGLETPKVAEATEVHNSQEASSAETPTTFSPGEQNNNDKFFSTDTVKEGSINIVEEVTRYEPIEKDIETHTIYLITHEKKKLPPIRTVKVFSSKSNSLEESSSADEITPQIKDDIKNNKIVDKKSSSTFVEVETSETSEAIETLSTEKSSEIMESTTDVSEMMEIQEASENEEAFKIQEPSITAKEYKSIAEETESGPPADIVQEAIIVTEKIKECEFDTIFEQAIFGSVQDRNKTNTTKERQTSPEIPYQQLVEEVKTYSLNLDFEQLGYDYSQFLAKEHQSPAIENINIVEPTTQPSFEEITINKPEIPLEEVPKQSYQIISDAESNFGKDQSIEKPIVITEPQKDSAYIIEKAPRFSYYDIQDAECNFAFNSSEAGEDNITREEQPSVLPHQILAGDTLFPSDARKSTIASAETDFISAEQISSLILSDTSMTVDEQSEPCETHVIRKSLTDFEPLREETTRQSYHEIVDAEILLASINSAPRQILEVIQSDVEMIEPNVEPARENSTNPVFEPLKQSYHEICDAERLLGEIKSREPSPSPEIELVSTTVTLTETDQVPREQIVNQVTPVTNGVVVGPLIAEDMQDEEQRQSVYEVPQFSYHEIRDAENLYAHSVRPLQSVILQEETREINIDAQDPTTSSIVILEEVTSDDYENLTIIKETISTDVDVVPLEDNQTKKQSPPKELVSESSSHSYHELQDAELAFANITTQSSIEKKQDETVTSTNISLEVIDQSVKSTPEIVEKSKKDQFYESASEPAEAFEIHDHCDSPVTIVYGTNEKSERQIETRKADDTVEFTEPPSIEEISKAIEVETTVSDVPDAHTIFSYEIDDLDDTLVPVVFGDIKKVETAIKERQNAQLKSVELPPKKTSEEDAKQISEEVREKPVETPHTISAAFIQSEISYTFTSLSQEPITEIKSMCPESTDTPEQSRDAINTDQNIVTELSKDSVDSIMSEQLKSDTSVKSEKSPIHSLHDLLPEIDSIPEFKPSFSNTVLYSNLSADAPEFTPSYLYRNIESTVSESKPTSMTVGSTQSSIEIQNQSQIAPEIMELRQSRVSLPQTSTPEIYSTITRTQRETEESESKARGTEPETIQHDIISLKGFTQEEHVDTKTKRSKKKKKKEDKKEVPASESQSFAAPSLEPTFARPEPVNVWAKAAEEGKSYAEVVAEGSGILPPEKELHAEMIKEEVKNTIEEPPEAESVHGSWAKITSASRSTPDKTQKAEMTSETVQTTHRPPMILVDESNSEHHKPEVEVDSEGFITVERHRRSRSRSRDNMSCSKSKSSQTPDTRDKSENRFDPLTNILKSEDTESVHGIPQDEEKQTVQKGRKSRSSKSKEKEMEPKIIFPSTSDEDKLAPKKDKKKRSSKSKEKTVKQEKEVITPDKKEIKLEKEMLQPNPVKNLETQEETSIVTQSETQENKKKSKKKKKDKKTEIGPTEPASSVEMIHSEQETNIEKQAPTKGYQRLIETPISTPESVHTPIKERIFSEAQYWKVDPSGLEDLSHLDENITIEKAPEEVKPAEAMQPQQVISNVVSQLQPDVTPESDEKKTITDFITHEILTSINEKQEQLAEKISEEQSLESKMADLQREIEEMLLPENDSLLGDDTPKELTDMQSSGDYLHDESLDNITPALASPEPCDEVAVEQKIDVKDVQQYQLDDKHISMSMIDSLLDDSEVVPATVHRDISAKEPEQAIQTKEHESKLTPAIVLPEVSLDKMPVKMYELQHSAENKETQSVDLPKSELFEESRKGSAEEHDKLKQSDKDTVSSQFTQVVTTTKILDEPVQLSEPLLTNYDPTINNLLNLKEDHFWTDKFITDDAERLLLDQNYNFPKPIEIISEFKTEPNFEFQQSEIKIDPNSEHSDDDISVEENISNDSSFWPEKHLYHDAEREYFLLMARESKSPSPPKVEIEIKDQNDKDKGPGGGSGHSSETEEPRDSCGSPFDSNYISMDLPGGICSWKDQSSYLSLETPTDSLGPISENTPRVGTDSQEDILTTSPHEPVAPPPPSQEQPGGEDTSQRRAKVTDPQSYCTILQFTLYVWHDILTKFLISLIMRICIVRCRVAMPNLPFVL